MSEKLTHISKFNDTERKILHELTPENYEREPPRLSVTEIDKKIDTDRTELSRRLKKLSEEGVLEKKEDEDDKRKSVYRIPKDYRKKFTKIKSQDADLKFIEDAPLNQIQYMETFNKTISSVPMSVTLYGIEDRDKDKELEEDIREEIRSVRNKIKSYYEPEMKEQFGSHLHKLIDEYTSNPDQKEDLEEIFEELRDALWKIDLLKIEYRNNLSEEVSTTDISDLDALEQKNKKLKWRVKKLDSPENFIQDAKILVKEAKEMRLTIN